ncbi:amino acid deaminase/aldolase [Herbidospora mongoliensis]|uniref:amino acid deaminase/aldolase n=1 Tax=Herbidospora mongoliensis TaxID=688067 RepID=UPI000833ED42|nr:amino acid deaminase/aldolase [Herbidospora mongoliensis]
MSDRQRYDRATSHLDPPLAIVDLDAMAANARSMTERADGKPIRVASKSIRSREVLRRVLDMPGYQGIMAFTLPEALWLVSHGFRNILVAYPTADRAAVAELADDETASREITLMVDSPEQFPLLTGRYPIRVCLDICAAYVVGPFRAGALRSPVHTPEQAADTARLIGKNPSLHLVGLMAYESQIAGVGDRVPGPYGVALRFVQRRSRRELAARRELIVKAVGEVTDLEFVNGGGTGSIETTARENVITEVAAGSGFYHPALFDRYSNFTGRPAAIYALPVVRRPARGVVTVLGGGYPASGAGPGRAPVPHLPEGLRYNGDEGGGEVQTPLHGRAADDLKVGDRVWFRHAKAGELCERFSTLHLVEGDRVTGAAPTYRGEGQTFL